MEQRQQQHQNSDLNIRENIPPKLVRPKALKTNGQMHNETLSSNKSEGYSPPAPISSYQTTFDGSNNPSQPGSSENLPTSLSLRPIALSLRDRKQMLLQPHEEKNYAGSEPTSDYDFYDECNMSNYNDSISSNKSQQHAMSQQINSQAISSDNFQQTQVSGIYSHSKPSLSVNSSHEDYPPPPPLPMIDRPSFSSVQTDEDSFTSDEESSYFSEKYHSSSHKMPQKLTDADNNPVIPFRPYYTSIGSSFLARTTKAATTASAILVDTNKPSQSFSSFRHSKSSTSLSLSESSEDEERHQNHRYPEIPIKTFRKNSNGSVCSSSNQEYENDSSDSDTDSEVFRASSKLKHENRTSGRVPHYPVNRDDNTIPNQVSAIQQSKFVNHSTQFRHPFPQPQSNSRIQSFRFQNEFPLPYIDSPVRYSSTSTAFTHSSIDSSNRHSRHLSSPFTSFSGSRATLNMEYSSDEGSEYLEEDEKFAANSTKSLNRSSPIHMARDFFPSEFPISPSDPLHNRRWIMLIYIAVLNFLSEWTCYSVAPIATIMSNEYSRLHPSGLISVFLIAKCFATTQETYILFKLGLRWIVVLGSALLWLGSLIKTISYEQKQPLSVLRLYLAFFLVGFSQPLYQHAAGAVASSWFPESEKSRALSLMLGTKRLGIFFSFFLGAMAVKTIEDVDQYFAMLQMISAIVCLGVCVQFEVKPVQAENNAEANTLKANKQNKNSPVYNSTDIVGDVNAGNEIYGPPDLKRISIREENGTSNIGSNSNHMLKAGESQCAKFCNLGDENAPHVPSQHESTTKRKKKIPPIPSILPVVRSHNGNSESLASPSLTHKSTHHIQNTNEHIFLFMKECLSFPGFVYSLVSFVPSSVIISTLSANMNFLLVDSKKINMDNQQITMRRFGGSFQALIMISSFIIENHNSKKQSYYSSILGLLFLGIFALAECAVSLDPEKGWDERWSLLLVALLVGPLQYISTEFGANIALPFSKNTVLIIQELFADIFGAVLIPLFHIFRNFNVSLTSIDSAANQYEFSFGILIGLLFCSALFFASFKGRHLRATTGQTMSAPNYLYLENVEEEQDFYMDENDANVVGSDVDSYHSSASV